MATTTPFPLRGQAVRMDTLRVALRLFDTGNVAIKDLVTVCENAVPGATIEEIADALSQVAAEQRLAHLSVRDRMTRGNG